MKQPKNLTVAMKKLLQQNELNPNDWWYIENTSKHLVILNKVNCEIKTIIK